MKDLVAQARDGRGDDRDHNHDRNNYAEDEHEGANMVARLPQVDVKVAKPEDEGGQDYDNPHGVRADVVDEADRDSRSRGIP